MKYRATEYKGKFYVGNSTGSEFYPSTECDSMDEAKKQVTIWQIQHLYNSSRDLFDKAQRNGVIGEDVDFHDLLC